MKTMNKPLLAGFAVLIASALVVGYGTRGENANRQPGRTNENADAARSREGNEMNTDVNGNYANVNGLKMYYEIHAYV